MSSCYWVHDVNTCLSINLATVYSFNNGILTSNIAYLKHLYFILQRLPWFNELRGETSRNRERDIFKYDFPQYGVFASCPVPDILHFASKCTSIFIWKQEPCNNDIMTCGEGKRGCKLFPYTTRCQGLLKVGWSLLSRILPTWHTTGISDFRKEYWNIQRIFSGKLKPELSGLPGQIYSNITSGFVV